MRPHYDVVVVGSGYGGAVAASRLARAGRSVCLLERGPERHAGEFPDTPLEAAEEMQTHSPLADTGPRTGLFDFHVEDGIVVLSGCGLGGTSLINANVSLRADPRVFDDPAWPAALRADRAVLDEGYARAEQMLGANPYPDALPPLAKYQGLERSAARLGLPVYKTAINVTFEDGRNHAGVEQQACTLCGDCVTGCNHGAKNTTLMNYLPDADHHGAEIFTCTAVQRLERAPSGGWLVHFEPLAVGRETFNAAPMFVAADVVVVSAGALGSTGILLRSHAAGVPMSSKVGTRFSGNGDVIGFAYNADQPIHGIGLGSRAPVQGREVGPCITGVIDGRATTDVNEGFIIEEGDVPGPVGTLNPLMYVTAGPFIGEKTDHEHKARQALKTLSSLTRGPYTGATDSAQTFLVMSHDDSGGHIRLEDGRLRVHWGGVGEQPHFARMDRKLEEASAAMNAEYFRNPLWTSLLGERLITVHPLGGVPMGESGESGAVNHKGQVFRGDTGTDVYDDLYVMDGSVMPRSLGVNPLITISSVAERNSALLAKDRGWTIDYSPNGSLADDVQVVPSLQFTETMRGFWSPGSDADFDAAAVAGKSTGSKFEFTLTVDARDARAMIATPPHNASMFGTVTAPDLSPDPLSVTQGQFSLFSDFTGAAEEKRMRYGMVMRSPAGMSWYMDGYKRVRQGSLLHIWPDTSTLYITIHEGTDASGAIVGRGVLHIGALDFQKQMGTMKVVGAASSAERLAITYDFGKLFAGVLYDTYGTVFGQTTTFHPDPTPRKRRPLAIGAPEVHAIAADDGTPLVLTRYQGGTKGPVILAPGFGMPASSWLIDTVDKNFVEFLYAEGYDIWLFDYRSSTALPSSSQPYTIDDVAKRDWPAAVAAVRASTGKPDVQVVGHCVGSMSFLMAQLAGLTGVRSAVCSALTVHPKAPTLSEIKAKLHLPSVLNAIGLHTLTTERPEPRWFDKALNEVMRLYPTHERCHLDVCRKILFMYGEVYKHSQLNEATHVAMHEWFGVAHMKPFAQLAASAAGASVVDAEGDDTYLPNVARLAMPITFIHGELNNMFLPEGSRMTYDWVREHNGDAHYKRIVVPNYGHLDCFFGKDASTDVFPLILSELEQHQQPEPHDAGLAGAHA
ncbi:MAG: alpha/beta fold hydrolase [Gemmatimonadaceae bacterium]